MAPASAQEKTALHLAVKKGDKACFRYRTSTAQKIDFGANVVDTENVLEFGFAWEVRAVAADGSFDATFRVLHVRGSSQQPGQPAVAFDSSKPCDPEGDIHVDAAYCSLAGREFPIHVTARGEVSSLDGAAAAVDAARKVIGERAAPNVENWISATSLQRLAGATLAYLPAAPVALDETWERKERVATGSNVVIQERTYKLAKVGADAIDVDIRGKVTTPDDLAKPKAGEEAAAPPPLLVDDSDVTGAMTLQRAGCLLQSAKQTAHVKMSLSLPQGKIRIDQTTATEVAAVTEAEAKGTAPK